MASRKDKKGRVLRKGESFRESDSMYVYSYSDPFGKRRYTYSKDLKKLREKEEQLKKDQMDGIDSYVAGSADLNFLFDRYIELKRELRETTRANYIATYDRYVRNGFGQKKIGEIKFSDVVFFYNNLMTEKNLHIGTIEYIQRLIRPSLELAIRDNIIRSNPANGVIQQVKRKSLGGCTSNVRHALTIEQQRAFLSFIDENALYNRWKPLFTFLLGTGCRIGEVIGLRWEDVDMDERTISINHTLVYFAGTKNKSTRKWVVHEPKTKAGIRIIPMVEPVYTALIEEKSRQDEEGIVCQTVVDNMSGFVFCNRFHTIHNPESVNKELNRIVEDYNSTEEIRAIKENREPILLPFFSCHHLRHTFCTRLCEADAPIKVIQSVMGHKDIQTTMDIYAEVSDQKKKDSLDEVFNEMNFF